MHVHISQPNYQKFRKNATDPSQHLHERIQRALVSGKLSELQEVYKAACSRDGTRFLVESRLVGKVIAKIQGVAIVGLRKAAKNLEVEDCRKIASQIERDSTLAPLAKNKEFRKVKAFMKMILLVEKIEGLKKNMGLKREPALDTQEQTLEALRTAVREAEHAGVPSDKTSVGRDAELKMETKLRALARLRSVAGGKDYEETTSALKEAEAAGVLQAEVDIVRAHMSARELDAAVSGGKVDLLRELIEAIDKVGGVNGEREQVEQARLKLYYAELIISTNGNSAEKLRTAIANCIKVGMKDQIPEPMQKAQARLPDLERMEASHKMTIQRLEDAVCGRNVSEIQAFLFEAERSGAEESLLNRAKAVLCEEDLQTAITSRNPNILAIQIPKAQSLGCDPNLLDVAFRVLEQDDPKTAVALEMQGALASKPPDVELLRACLSNARKLGVETYKVREATWIVQEADEAEERERRAAYEAAQEASRAQAAKSGAQTSRSSAKSGAQTPRSSAKAGRSESPANASEPPTPATTAASSPWKPMHAREASQGRASSPDKTLEQNVAPVAVSKGRASAPDEVWRRTWRLWRCRRSHRPRACKPRRSSPTRLASSMMMTKGSLRAMRRTSSTKKRRRRRKKRKMASSMMTMTGTSWTRSDGHLVLALMRS